MGASSPDGELRCLLASAPPRLRVRIPLFPQETVRPETCRDTATTALRLILEWASNPGLSPYLGPTLGQAPQRRWRG